ncbi:MAG: aminotransferase class I/II-fold pyridoxal phosphate-dependent enzyme [Oenococcus oeni]
MNKATHPLSDRIKNIPHDPMLDFLDKVEQSDDLVDLGFGDPDFAVGKKTKEAFKTAIDADRSHYADGQGILELREAAKDFYNKKYDCRIESANDVLVTVGAAEGINLALLALANPGDGVMIVEPEYSQYSTALCLARAAKIPIDTKQTAFKLTPELIKNAYNDAISKGINPIAIVINYPNNPTGITYNRSELNALANVFRELKIWVLSDEIYAEQTYIGSHVSLYSILPEQTILITGLSKSHSMTGYRLGFVISHGRVMKAMRKIHDTLLTCVATPIQDAAAFALKNDPDAGVKTRSTYLERVTKVTNALNALGFQVKLPQGAFYVWAKIPDKFGDDADNFCLDLAQRARVQIFPGSIFSDTAKNYVRISCAGSDAHLDSALRRITDYLQNC